MSSPPTEPGPPTPADSPLRLGDVMSSPFYGNLMAPELSPGERAYGFELPLLDGSGHVRLEDFAGERPVALVFGPYT